MKKKYLISYLVTIIIVSVLLIPVTAHSQELTPEQKQVRCQNNRDRIAELDKQLKRTNDSLAQIPEKKEVEDARSYLSYIRKFKNPNNPSVDPRNKSDENFIKIKRIAVQYNFDFEKCIYQNFREGEEPYYISKFCYSELEKIIAKRIDKSESLQSKRSELISKKNEIDKQLAAHRNNLIALRCDDKTNKTTGTCILAGTWVHITEGIGTTTWTITSDGTATEEGKGYAKGIATLKGNTLHIKWETNNGYSGYYEWRLNSNCSSNDGELVFESGGKGTHKSTVKWSQ